MLSKAAGQVAQVSMFTRPKRGRSRGREASVAKGWPYAWEQHGQGWDWGSRQERHNGSTLGFLSVLTL